MTVWQIIANCCKTALVHEVQCTLCMIGYHVICYCRKFMYLKYDKCNVTVYDM